MPLDPVARVRRFNRAVTLEAGALDTSFLGRGRPLGAARVLNAIGNRRSDVADVRAHPDDARRRVAKLTAAGRHEFQAYETLSNSRAETLLARHSHPEALLAAMDIVASALGRGRIAIEEMDPRGDDARYCLGEYYAELARRFEGGFDVSLSRNPEADDMIRPRGAFVVAMSDGLPIGCVGLKRTGSEIAEVKRLWVAPSARGLGVVRRLMDAAENAARQLSIKTLRLDTNRALREALQLYRSTGWSEIDRFNDDPYPDFFFEKHR